jgi:hypothetical protein
MFSTSFRHGGFSYGNPSPRTLFWPKRTLTVPTHGLSLLSSIIATLLGQLCSLSHSLWNLAYAGCPKRQQIWWRRYHSWTSIEMTLKGVLWPSEEEPKGRKMEEVTGGLKENLRGLEEEEDKHREICRFLWYTSILAMPSRPPSQGGLYNQILSWGEAEGPGV